MKKLTFSLISVWLIGLLMLVVAILSSGCTDNVRAKLYGGTMKRQLPKNQKLMMVTWKEGGNLWILTRPMRTNEMTETYTFQEDSTMGLIQGTVIIQETKE